MELKIGDKFATKHDVEIINIEESSITGVTFITYKQFDIGYMVWKYYTIDINDFKNKANNWVFKKEKEEKESKCPYGGEFGIHYDEGIKCNECELWDACGAEWRKNNATT